MTGRLRLVAGGRAPGRPSYLLDGPIFCPPHGLPAGLRGDELGDHLRRYGPRPVRTAAELLGELEQCDLRGHGGGWFPVAAKWRSALSSNGDAIVVANAAESEPGSAKDAVLSVLHPHLVLDGLMSAAAAIGATEAVVWIHVGRRDVYRAMAHAIAQRRAARMPDVPTRIEVAPDHYLSGESSSIVHALSGGLAIPRFRTVPATVSGVHGRPTLVHNVETLARIGLLARTGGVHLDPTMLVTVATSVGRVVAEVEVGTPVAAVLEQASAGPAAAVLVGGFGGTWRAGQELEMPIGPAIGAGILLPLDTGACGLAVSADIVAYLAASSARQCGPCVFGLPAVADLFGELVAGRQRRSSRVRLHRYLAEIDGRGACHHPDGAVRLVDSALRVFSADLVAHRSNDAHHQAEYGFFPAARWRDNS